MSTDLLAALGKARAALEALEAADGGRAGVVRSSQATDVVDELTRLGTADALDEAVRSRQLVLPVRLRHLLDWRGKAANKPCLRVGAAALADVADDGTSRYPVAVEALSYAAACAPYLEPDKIAALLRHCAAAPYAWAPVTATARLSADLRTAIGHYSPARQFDLMCALWDAAHDVARPRWWDHCGGRGTGGRRRSTRSFQDAAAGALATAGIEVTDDRTDHADGVEAAPDDRDLVERLLGDDLAVIPPTVAELQAARVGQLPAGRAAALREWATLDHPDLDVSVLCALVPDLEPHSRPANPMGRMVEALIMAWTGDDGVMHDRMPDKPSDWPELFPAASLVGYPIPPAIAELDERRVDPPPSVDDEPFVVVLLTDDDELATNRDFMGNCTYSYRTRCAAGTTVLGKIHHKRETYNFAWQHTRGQSWTLEQINGFQNQRGRVPDWVAGWARDTAASLRCEPLPSRDRDAAAS